MAKGKIKQRNKYSSEATMGENYIKILIVLAIIFLIFYLITYFVTKKKTESNVETTIQYKEIIVGNILNINQDEYYVLVEFENDKYNSLYETYLTNYSQKENSKAYYIVDMSKGFNKNYVSEENNLNTNNVSEIKFSQTTLLKIKSGSIIEKFTSKEEIIAALEKL